VKKLFLIISIFFILNSVFSQTTVNQNGLQTTVIGPFSGPTGSGSKRFEIANVGYNSHNWQTGGSIVVELFQMNYSTDYQKYIIENGYQQGTDLTLPDIRLVEVSGKVQAALISLGTPSDLTSTFYGYINKSVPMILDLKADARYRVRITYQQNLVTEITNLNQIKINEVPISTDISNFSVSTELNNNISSSGYLRITGAGNHYVQNGNLGIGTTAPDEKLTVKGKIHTQEVKVDMAGPLVPDYVFANDYKLKSLQEVEDFIKENKHLPEIPSAQEIEKNGLMLAEMNMNLLKKIEEMTLYMIEMKKENEEMKKDILDLKNK
jgi:hypothetical protein